MEGSRSLSFSGVSASCDMLRTRFRRLRPDEDPDNELATFNIVVMEVCVYLHVFACVHMRVCLCVHVSCRCASSASWRMHAGARAVARVHKHTCPRSV